MAASYDLEAQLTTILSSLPFDQHAAQVRKTFLELSNEDSSLLQQLAPSIKNVHQQLMDDFYLHLQSFPETNKFLKNEKTVKQLKQQQSAYFSRLVSGEYDWDYVQNRLRVGAVHQFIGLESQWYIGAYSKYLVN